MYLIEAFFSLQTDQFSLEKQSHCVNQIIEQWRYNGQIIGREIPQFVAEQENQTGLAVRVTCPEQTSLLAEFNNSLVDDAIQAAEKCGVFFKSFQIVAESILEEEGKFYEILVVESGQMKLSASDVRFGPFLSKEVSPVFVQKWQKEAVKLEFALEQIPEKNLEERQVLVDKIQAIKEVLSC